MMSGSIKFHIASREVPGLIMEMPIRTATTDSSATLVRRQAVQQVSPLSALQCFIGYAVSNARFVNQIKRRLRCAPEVLKTSRHYNVAHARFT